MPVDKKRAQQLFAKFNKITQEVAADPTAEHVHHLRTNSRRVEAWLKSHAPTSSTPEKLFKELKRFRKQAGKVRDLDVQISALKSVQLERHHEHKQRVLNALQRRRAKKAKRLVSLVLESRGDLQKRIQKRKAKIFAEPGRDENQRSNDFYQAALDSFKQAAEQHGILSGATIEPEKLHEFRLAAKHARYTAELAADRPQARALVKELVRVQDAIGDWHDWQVLQESAAEELSDLRASALVSILQNIVGAKFASAMRTTAKVTEKLLEHPKESLQKKGPTSARSAVRTDGVAAGF
jgi:CHAD domain-containing protein